MCVYKINKKKAKIKYKISFYFKKRKFDLNAGKSFILKFINQNKYYRNKKKTPTK